MAKRSPKSLSIHTYNVGFGDCFLLSFAYSDRKRHVLIDFGSMRRPANAKKNHMVHVANEIKKNCGGKLDAIVATHRHQDHISGFATNKKKSASGNIIASLNPDVVVQPWTEHPRAPRDAKVAPSRTIRQAYARKLDNMNQFADSVTEQLKKFRGVDAATKTRLGFLGENNISNKSAVKNLFRMAEKGSASYVHTDSTSGLERMLPGVKVHVLGPPTLVQTDTIKEQVRSHPDEFWHLQSKLRRDDFRSELLFPKHKRGSYPAYARWFIQRLNLIRAEELFQIVRILDDAMNNTSVILLFECGTKSFLFSGDAQWENWAYALSKEKYVKLLRNVDLYKVGHHGSLNATPKSLWKLFRQKGKASKKNRLITLMSTKAGVHGHEDRNSEVPKETLVKELKKKSKLESTQTITSGLKKTIQIKLG